MVIYGDAEEQFRLLFEAAPNGMIVTDHDGVITFVNKQTEKLFGYSREELFGRSVDVLVPERFQGAHPSLRAQFARQPETRAMGAGRDLYGLRKNKTEFPVEIGLNPFRSGDRVLVIASVVDITERKRHEEHIRFIMDELSHRSKNLLSVVLAVAHQTVEQATSFGEFQSNFESRLMALARSHDLLVEQGWSSGALIEALVFVQLKPFIDDPAARLDAAGPPIMLTPLAAQNIGLALHELAANAMKYGALSSREGRIVIRWELDDRQLPYFGEHPLVQSHYLAKRSRRQPSILTFLAQDADSHVFCYANADIRKGEEADEVFRFIDFWKRQYGRVPQHLVFDSKLTTYEGLDRLDAAGITFMTLRRRTKGLLADVDGLPPSAWRTVTLDLPHRKYRTPRIYEQKVRLRERSYRQLFIKDLGHDEPTILITNDAKSSARNLITRYAKRMLIENALADAVRFFHIDALSSSVGFKVDFDMALLVLASALYRLTARRMRGYDDAQARQIFRDLVDMPADVAVTPAEVRVRFHRRAHLPIVLASGLIDKPVTVPWWQGRSLRLVQ